MDAGQSLGCCLQMFYCKREKGAIVILLWTGGRVRSMMIWKKRSEA